MARSLVPPTSPVRGRRLVARATCGLLFLVGAAVSSCNTVEFYELERLGDPVMQLEGSPGEAHFLQKVLYSMEGSAGGIGTSAGGGCGCY